MGAGLGCAIGSCFPGPGNIIGLAVGAVAGLIYGIVKECVDPSKKWKEDAKKNFEDLLNRCNNGEHDCYIKLYNIHTRIKNTRTALVEILTKINEFNLAHANMSKAFEQQGLKTSIAQDGITITGVNTTVNIGGQSVEMSLSEAMNAFYTYETTVMESQLQADYLNKTYGYEFNYTELVNNANAFTSKAITSGLYTHEFIEAILPEKSPSHSNAVNQVSNDSGLESEKIEEAINKISGTGSTLGFQLLGSINKENTKEKEEVEEEEDQDIKKDRSKSSKNKSESSSKNQSSSSNSSSSQKSDITYTTTDKSRVTTSVPTTSSADLSDVTSNDTADKLNSAVNSASEEATEMTFASDDSASPDDSTSSDDSTSVDNNSTSEENVDIKNYKLNIINELWDEGKKEEIKDILINIGYTQTEAESIASDRAKLNDAVVNGKKNDIGTLDPSRDDGKINSLNVEHDYSSDNTVDENNANNSIENINNISLNYGFVNDNDDNELTNSSQSENSISNSEAKNISAFNDIINLDNLDTTIMN